MKRKFHPWHEWECFKAGFYETAFGEREPDALLDQYAEFLRDTPRFEAALERVLSEWPISCEQFLSNESLNRIAWLGQASMCIATGVPSCFRGGFKRLSALDQATANATADRCLRQWISAHDDRSDSALHRHLEAARIPVRYPRRSSRTLNAARLGSVVQGNLFGHS